MASQEAYVNVIVSVVASAGHGEVEWSEQHQPFVDSPITC